MAVYVDDMEAPYGNMIMCHMWADTDEELLTMADKISVQRKWIQGHQTLSLERYKKASWVHFDIARSKRVLAIQNGAIETDRYGALEHTAKLLIASGNPKLVEIGNRKLEMVAYCRNK